MSLVPGGGGGRPLLLHLPQDEGGGGESPGGGGQKGGITLPPQVRHETSEELIFISLSSKETVAGLLFSYAMKKDSELKRKLLLTTKKIIYTQKYCWYFYVYLKFIYLCETMICILSAASVGNIYKIKICLSFWGTFFEKLYEISDNYFTTLLMSRQYR